jgi:hypothetical protein
MASASSAPADTPKRDRTHRRTSSTKKASWAANRWGSNPGAYSCSRSVSSGGRRTPDDHGGRRAGVGDAFAPRRGELTVTGDHHGLRRRGRKIRRNLPTAVVAEGLRDEASAGGRHLDYPLQPKR